VESDERLVLLLIVETDADDVTDERLVLLLIVDTDADDVTDCSSFNTEHTKSVMTASRLTTSTQHFTNNFYQLNTALTGINENNATTQ